MDKNTIILVVLVVVLAGLAIWNFGTVRYVLKDFYNTRAVVAMSMENYVDFANKVLTLETKVNFLEEKVAGLEALSLPSVPAPPKP